MNTYAEIIWTLKEPVMGEMLDAPQTREDWKRFFGMMDTLERNQIAEFKGGRYVLHPSRKADVVEQAMEVLAGISKPLTLTEPEVVAVAAPLMPEFNVCPACKGKGRVQIEDALGFFGSYLCLTCGGKKQIPVPSRSTFPPVDLSRKPQSPNALLFADTPKPVAPIPQVLEVSGVRVIVEAPAPVLSMVAEEVQSETLVAIAEPLNDDTQPLPELVPADCPKCQGSGIVLDNSSGVDLRVRTCPDCGGSGEMQEIPLVDVFADFDTSLDADYSPSDELITPVLAAPAPIVVEAAEAIVEVIAPVIAAEPSQYVRINTTGRGLSSGKYEVIRQEEKYGRSWMVVKFTTAAGLPHWFPAEKCELVVG